MSVVGQSVKRNDAKSKVIGEALYIDDYGYDGMLHCVTLRSPKQHIKIKKLNITKAKKVPGFVRLITANDIANEIGGKNLWPLVIHDYPFLADGIARFHGEAIGLVIAETPEAASKAANLIEIDYEELPFVTDSLKAMEPDAVKVYEGEFGKNIFSQYKIRKGDVEKGFAESDVVVEQTFTTGFQVQAYLETQGMIGFPDSSGGITVYGSMQCPYYVHDAVVAATALPYNKVRIVQRCTGGGFGGKEDVPALVGAQAAIAAFLTKRPVKIIYTRSEDFISMSKRHPSWVHIKYGAKRDGTILACEVKYILDGGAYSTLSPIVLWRGTVHAAGPYKIPNVKIDSYVVATNKVPSGAFRGFGQPQVCFANESLIDELAEKLGMDPVEFRLINALRIGETTATGQVIKESCGLIEAIEKVRDASDWKEKFRRTTHDPQLTTRHYGIGISANYYGVALGARGRYLDRAASHVQVQPDGTVIVAVGNTEIGQGMRTVLAQICADSLNAPYEMIQVLETDTTRVPDSGPTVASRTTLMSGNAILNACEPIRERINQTAAQMLGISVDELQASNGEFFSNSPLSRGIADGSVAGVSRRAGVGDEGEKKISYQDVIKECHKQKLQMTEQGWYASPPTSFDENGQGNAYVTYAYSANVAEVEVDTETGEVKVLKVTSAHDIGKVINPNTAEGQIEGGITQGIGYALIEELIEKDGILKNPNFTDYILPSSHDAPEYQTILLEHPYPAGPFGAKGLAESPLIGPAPAITNAIKNAVGIRLTHIPAMPEKIWEKLKNLKREEQL